VEKLQNYAWHHPGVARCTDTPCHYRSIARNTVEENTMQHRFWSKVNKHGPFPNAEAIKHHTEIAGTRCWVWTAGRNGSTI